MYNLKELNQTQTSTYDEPDAFAQYAS